MLSNKYKAMLTLHGIQSKEYAKKLNIKSGTLSSKIQRNIWTLADMVTLAEATNSKVCLVDNDSKEIIMTIDRNDIL